jgi:hypothetical protein
MNENNFTKDNSTKSMMTGQHSTYQNLSGFIKHSKYFQMYEDFRRGFLLIEQLREDKLSDCFQRMRKQAFQSKQKQEHLLQMTKSLVAVLKEHVKA